VKIGSAIIFALFYASSCIVSFTSLQARELIGTFLFKKRTPRSALIYFPEDQSAKLQAMVDQKNTRFMQSIVLGSKGEKVLFKNSDTINHNIYVDDREAKVQFDIGLAPPGSTFEQEITWDEGTVLRLSCKIHPRMRSWVASISSPYNRVIKFKRKKKKKSFKIINIPEHLRRVKIWIPGYDALELQLSPGKAKKVFITKKKKKRGILKLTLQ